MKTAAVTDRTAVVTDGIAVVTDSNSGITQEDAKALGLYVVPMPFMIDGETYEEGINLSHEDFYARQEEGADITTSQPSPKTVMGLWDELLTRYNQVVHIPMSSGLSGSCQTALMLAEDYGGRVQVVDNQRISVTQRQSALDALELARAGLDAVQVKEVLERTRLDSSIYITVDTLKYLKKGGRITPAAAALGTLLKIKPVLQIQGDKLDSFSKARTMKQAKSVMLKAMAHDLEGRFQGPEGECVWLEAAYTGNRQAAEEFVREIRERFPKAGEVRLDPLSLSVSCHIGPGALAIACVKRLDVEKERRICGA